MSTNRELKLSELKNHVISSSKDVEESVLICTTRISIDGSGDLYLLLQFPNLESITYNLDKHSEQIEDLVEQINYFLKYDNRRLDFEEELSKMFLEELLLCKSLRDIKLLEEFGLDISKSIEYARSDHIYDKYMSRVIASDLFELFDKLKNNLKNESDADFERHYGEMECYIVSKIPSDLMIRIIRKAKRPWAVFSEDAQELLEKCKININDYDISDIETESEPYYSYMPSDPDTDEFEYFAP